MSKNLITVLLLGAAGVLCTGLAVSYNSPFLMWTGFLVWLGLRLVLWCENDQGMKP